MLRLENISNRQLLIIFLLSFLMGLFLAFWYQNNVLGANELKVGVDIYPRWTGTRAFWNGQSPYSPEVDRDTQNLILGHPAGEGEDNFGFYYLAHAAVVLTPLAILPVTWAAILWVAFLWGILSVFIFILLQNYPGKPSLLIMAAIVLSVFLYQPFLVGILNGQYLLFVLVIWAAVYQLTRQGHEISAGFLLVLSSIKPSLSLFPILVFLLWFISTGRYKAIVSFAITSALFLLITFVQIGWWIPDFLAELQTYNTYVRQWASSDVFSISGAIWSVLTVVLLVLGFKAYWQDKKAFPWILFWGSISLVLLVSSHTSEYDFPLLILPFFFYAPRFWQTKVGTAVWFLIMWLPWLVLNIFADYTQGHTTFWHHQPQVVLIVLLFFLFVNRHLFLAHSPKVEA